METKKTLLEVYYKPSQALAMAIRMESDELSADELPVGIKTFVSCDDPADATITVKEMAWIKMRLHLKGQFLSQLIRGTEMIFPKEVDPPRNPELEARCQRLQHEQEDREYRAMTKYISTKRTPQPEESIAYQMKQINRQLIGVVQLIFSVGAGFAFGFLGVPLIVGNLDMGTRLLWGIGAAVTIFVAEIYFLIHHLSVEEDVVLQTSADTGLMATNRPLKHQTIKSHYD